MSPNWDRRLQPYVTILAALLRVDSWGLRGESRLYRPASWLRIHRWKPGVLRNWQADDERSYLTGEPLFKVRESRDDL